MTAHTYRPFTRVRERGEKPPSFQTLLAPAQWTPARTWVPTGEGLTPLKYGVRSRQEKIRLLFSNVWWVVKIEIVFLHERTGGLDEKTFPPSLRRPGGPVKKYAFLRNSVPALESPTFNYCSLCTFSNSPPPASGEKPHHTAALL